MCVCVCVNNYYRLKDVYTCQCWLWISLFVCVCVLIICVVFVDDCLQSCDASLLLDSTRRSLSEKETDRSFGLRNFRYLDTIKEAVERECPGVVSCADILVLSGRDGIVAVSPLLLYILPYLYLNFALFSKNTILVLLDLHLHIFPAAWRPLHPSKNRKKRWQKEQS